MFCSECKVSKDLDCHKMEEPSQSDLRRTTSWQVLAIDHLFPNPILYGPFSLPTLES